MLYNLGPSTGEIEVVIVLEIVRLYSRDVSLAMGNTMANKSCSV